MLSRPCSILAASALVLAACSHREAQPTPAAPAAPKAAPAAQAGPAAPPGHLLRAEVDRVLVTQGPPWILRRALVEEVIKRDGKFAGWRLVGLPEEWSAIDLKPGDIVTRVNGLAIETPDEAWEAWRSVASATDLKITVTRDGAAKQVVIPIDGAPSPETAKALLTPGPRPAAGPGDAPPAAPAPASAKRSFSLGGGQEPASGEDVY
jgi:hypothetical protein